MAKVDLRKELKHLYAPSAKAITEVEVPAFTFLMVDGQGDPNHSVDYVEAVEALFSVAYTAKFMVRKAPDGRDYAVMPLEGLESFSLDGIDYECFNTSGGLGTLCETLEG